MKRVSNIYPEIYEFDNLLKAAHKVLKGKKHTLKATEFYFNLEPNLLEISHSLKNKTYKPQKFHNFIIYQPKKCRISAADLYDNVVQHAICFQLEPYFEKFFIFHSFGSRKGKGPLKAMDCVSRFCKKFDYYLKLDIHKFFDSVDHKILKHKLASKFKDKDLLWLLNLIIDHTSTGSPPGKSIPIGNLTSQYFSNLYLDQMDHYIKEELKIKGYIRYMDDFVLFANDKIILHRALQELYDHLKSIKLELSQQILAPIREGVPFLGYHFFRNFIRIQQPKWRRFKKQFRSTQDAFLRGELETEKFINIIMGLTDSISYGNTRNLRGKFFQKYSIEI